MAGKGDTIIRKKITKSGHGHHGGAWKVAYADFVTAMMAFFLVMWLMGTDDTTKASIANYFNHPNTPFDPDSDPNANAIPRPGIRDSFFSGMDGAHPDDLVPNPARTELYLEKNRTAGEKVRLEMEGQAFNLEVEIEYLKFSLPEAALFEPGTSKLRTTAKERLDRMGETFKSYHGYVSIEDFTDETQLDGNSEASTYVTSTIKSVAVMNYLIEHNWLSEDRIRPTVGSTAKKRDNDPESQEKNSKPHIEFTLRQFKKY